MKWLLAVMLVVLVASLAWAQGVFRADQLLLPASKDGPVHAVRWSDGSAVFSGGIDYLALYGKTVTISWGTQQYVRFAGPLMSDVKGYPLVLDGTDIKAKVNGISVKCPYSIKNVTIEQGIIVSATCSPW